MLDHFLDGGFFLGAAAGLADGFDAGFAAGFDADVDEGFDGEKDFVGETELLFSAGLAAGWLFCCCCFILFWIA